MGMDESTIEQVVKEGGISSRNLLAIPISSLSSTGTLNTQTLFLLWLSEKTSFHHWI
jgi:hypothetical protein